MLRYRPPRRQWLQSETAYCRCSCCRRCSPERLLERWVLPSLPSDLLERTMILSFLLNADREVFQLPHITTPLCTLQMIHGTGFALPPTRGIRYAVKVPR